MHRGSTKISGQLSIASLAFANICRSRYNPQFLFAVIVGAWPWGCQPGLEEIFAVTQGDVRLRGISEVSLGLMSMFRLLIRAIEGFLKNMVMLVTAEMARRRAEGEETAESIR